VTFDLTAEFPRFCRERSLGPEQVSRDAFPGGITLTEHGLALAGSVGVRNPKHVRVTAVEALPLPNDPELKAAALQVGLLGPGVVGLTLGYCILLCRGHETPRLLSHELRHVHQYELAGSIAAFLPVYLQQIVQFGYAKAPLEVDARAHERDRG